MKIGNFPQGWPDFIDIWSLDAGHAYGRRTGGFVIAVTVGLIWFGERGRLLHRNYSSKAAAVGGDLIGIISNMWTVKAIFGPSAGVASVTRSVPR
jgi:hypothetical protein